MIRYLNKAKCIINQYTNYTFPQLDNLPLNGINTQVTLGQTIQPLFTFNVLLGGEYR